MQSLTDLQAAIAAVQPRGRGRRFSPELKLEAVSYIVAARKRGVTTAQLEADLGVTWNTLGRWLKPKVGAKRGQPKAVPVRIVPAPTELAAPSLFSPSGWRVEGLTFEQLRVLVGPR
jgi:hypothetical protein